MPARTRTTVAQAQKTLAVVYLEKAAKQLQVIGHAEERREVSQAIAYTYALLGERETGRPFLPPPPPRAHDDEGINRYLDYVSVLAAFGDYAQIEADIKQLDNKRLEALVRSYVVYYDAILASPHLASSLQDAAGRIDEHSDPHALFYLALGYELSGNSSQARQTCRMAATPQARFTACAYMSAAMGLAGEQDETVYYLAQAELARSSMDVGAEVDPYTQMLYGRALAYAGKLEQATEIYGQLESHSDAMHLGSVLARELYKSGRKDIEKSIVRNVQSRFSIYGRKSDRVDYLYNCYGDFLATLELFYELNTQIKQTPEPLLKAQLFLGGAQAVTDGYLFGYESNRR